MRPTATTINAFRRPDAKGEHTHTHIYISLFVCMWNLRVTPLSGSRAAHPTTTACENRDGARARAHSCIIHRYINCITRDNDGNKWYIYSGVGTDVRFYRAWLSHNWPTAISAALGRGHANVYNTCARGRAGRIPPFPLEVTGKGWQRVGGIERYVDLPIVPRCMTILSSTGGRKLNMEGLFKGILRTRRGWRWRKLQ